MMLGFVVRRCANAIGHDPTASEFAAWANTYREDGVDHAVYLFGRPISVRDAELILSHPARPVSARSARPFENVATVPAAAPKAKVTSFADAAARLRARVK